MGRETWIYEHVPGKKEGLQIYGMMNEGKGRVVQGLLARTNGCRDKVDVTFRTGDIGLRARRRKFGQADRDDNKFNPECGSDGFV